MPHLVIREQGSEYSIPITEKELSIGRSHQNDVKLLTEQASRKHCKIVRAGAGFKVVDTQSSNGIYINGRKLDEKELADGDVIGIGQAVLTFREGEPAGQPPEAAEHDTSSIPLQNRDVQIMINTIISAGSAKDLDSFLVEAVDNIVDIVKAERGILFMKDDAGQIKPRIARDGDRNPLPEQIDISRSTPQKVFDTRQAIYLLDSEQEGEIPSKSVSMYGLRTVMCAPMYVGDKVLGALYVDSHAKSREYSAVDLALFEAVTNYLALTVENVNARTEAKRREEEERRSLERENAMLRAALDKRKHLIGECAPMRSVYETLRKVAPTDANVLIVGESGTGKEAMAHAVHDLSPRGSAPFIVVDCAAIPETLIESELFGYEKGAFTGAVGTKHGKLEAADGGTIFFDEIGELPLTLQVKLLRALEQKTVTRVGGTEPIKVDVRIVAATNRDLEKMVAQGGFRQDLLFRLKVVSVALPPLRERGDDIVLLAQFFLDESNATNGRAIKGFSEEAKPAMLRHRWEGNIRELKHRIEQAVILTDKEYVSTEDLGLAEEGGTYRSLEAARDAFEKGFIVKALAGNGSNVTHTAKVLGISRQHLQNLIKKYGIAKATDAE